MRELRFIFLSYVNKDLIFLGHFSCHWIIAIDWPIKKKKKFPRGSQVKCGTLQWVISTLAWTVCTSCLCTQTKSTNQTKPELHQPEVTLQMKQKMTRNQKTSGKSAPQNGKVMPRNQKPNGIKIKHDFPVQLDLWPGKVSASSLFKILIKFQAISCWFSVKKLLYHFLF